MKLYSIFGNAGNEDQDNGRETNENDDATVIASENRSGNGRELREICLKWAFPMSGDKKKIMKSHHEILAKMLQANPGLIIIDNKGQEHTEKRTMAPSDRNRPFDFYHEKHGRTNQRTLACIHRLRTDKSLTELKESWGVLEELDKSKAYVRGHAFGEKEREISHIGFLPGVNMMNTNNGVVKSEIIQMLRVDNAEIPKFEIVQVRVDMGKGSKSSERTRAYEIQCLTKDAPRLSKLLQTGQFRVKPVYVPYRMKNSKPEVFKSAIKRQIKVLADQWVIKIQGFTPEMVHYLKQHVTDYKIEAVVPTYNTSKGEWKMLVHRNDHRKAVQTLKSKWNELIAEIPTTIKNDSPYDDPKIVSRNAATYASSSEEGTVDTYGTILSSLYYGSEKEIDASSEVTDGDQSNADDKEDRPVSYAKVLKGVNSSVSQVTGWTEQRQDEFAKLKEQHTNLEEKFNTVTAELSELKQMMQQLLVQSSQSGTIEPPPKKQATFNTPKRQEKRTSRIATDMDIEHEPATKGSETGQDQLCRNEY